MILILGLGLGLASGFALQYSGEMRAGAVDATLHGAGWAAGDLGSLLVGKPVDADEGDGFAFLEGKSCEGGFYVVQFDCRGLFGLADKLCGECAIHVLDFGSVLTGMGKEGVAHNGEQPGLYAADFPQARAVSPGVQQSVLDDVVSKCGVVAKRLRVGAQSWNSLH